MRKVLVSLVCLVVADLPGKHFQEILDECEESAVREYRERMTRSLNVCVPSSEKSERALRERCFNIPTIGTL